MCSKHERPLRETKEGEKICPICSNPLNSEIWDIVHRKNRNVLIVTEGLPGIGKSYINLKKAQDLDPLFFEDPDMTEEKLMQRVLYKPKDFADILNESKLYTGAVVILEEGGVQADHRKWFTFSNDLFNKIFQVFRHRKLIVMVNVPVMDYIDSDARKLFSFHIEAIDIDTKYKLNVYKVKRLSYNTTMKRVFMKYPRYNINGRYIKFRLWRSPGPSKTLTKVYEKVHVKFKREIVADFSKKAAMLDIDEKKKESRVLIDEEEATKTVIERMPEFSRPYSNRIIFDRSRIEHEFGVGRSIAERIKKGAEFQVNRKDVDNG